MRRRILNSILDLTGSQQMDSQIYIFVKWQWNISIFNLITLLNTAFTSEYRVDTLCGCDYKQLQSSQCTVCDRVVSVTLKLWLFVKGSWTYKSVLLSYDRIRLFVHVCVFPGGVLLPLPAAVAALLAACRFSEPGLSPSPGPLCHPESPDLGSDWWRSVWRGTIWRQMRNTIHRTLYAVQCIALHVYIIF